MVKEFAYQLPVSITTQFLTDPSFPIHAGEVIRDAEYASLCRSQIGWLDWCNESGSKPGVPTARLMIAEEKYGIKTDNDYRTPELKLGTELFIFQAIRLHKLGYVDYCILNVTESSLKFYKKAIAELIKVTDQHMPGLKIEFEEFELAGQNTLDDHSLRITFKTDTSILPDTEPVGSILGPDFPSP